MAASPRSGSAGRATLEGRRRQGQPGGAHACSGRSFNGQPAPRISARTRLGRAATIRRGMERGNGMATADHARGMIGVEKMGGKVLFLDPQTFETQVVIDGFP